MVLMSRIIRNAAITGRNEDLSSWFAGRQGGRWAQQQVQAVIPTARQPGPASPPAAADPRATLRELSDLHARGVLTEAEFEQMRGRLGV